MNTSKLILMLVGLVALVGYVYFVEVPQAEKAVQNRSVLSFESDTVRSLELIYPDRAIKIRQDPPGTWEIQQPIQARADDTALNNLVSTVLDEEITRSLDMHDLSDLDLYGLEYPLVRLKIELNNNIKLPTISLGKDTPVGFSAYILKEGNAQIHLARQAFRLGLMKGVDDLRDKRVVTLAKDGITKVLIKTTDHDTTLTKSNAEWEVEKPGPHPADGPIVEEFLSNILAIRAQEFIDDYTFDLSEMGLNPGIVTLSLEGAAGEAQQIIIGTLKESDNDVSELRYAKRQGEKTLLLVDKEIVSELTKSPNEFRSKIVITASDPQIETVAVTRSGEEDFVIALDENREWGIDKTMEGVLSRSALERFVKDLTELRGYEIASDDPDDLNHYGLANPRIAFKMLGRSGEETWTILLGQNVSDDVDSFFAMQQDRSTVFALKDYVYSRLDKGPEDFWEKPQPSTDGDN